MVHRDGRVVFVRDEARLIAAGSGPPLWRGVLIDMSASRAAAGRLSAPGGDAVRLNCTGCGASWVAETHQPCPGCGSQVTDAISLNATLAALAGSRREVEALLAGVHQHLDELGGILGPLPRRRGPTDEGASN